MLTDELIREALRRAKSQRQGTGSDDGVEAAGLKTECGGCLKMAHGRYQRKPAGTSADRRRGRARKVDRRKIVIEAMEDAIQKAAKSRYGARTTSAARSIRRPARRKLTRVLAVVDERRRTKRRRSRLPTPSDRNPDAKVGDIIAEALPPLDFGRVAAQTAKQVIVQKVREAERERQYDEYKDRIGEIVNGTVKRVEYGNVIVDLGRAEGIIRRDEMIPRENFRFGDRIRAYIYDVRREQRGPQIFLSRARPRIHGASCSRRKCRKSTTASSRSRRWPAIRAPAPRSP